MEERFKLTEKIIEESGKFLRSNFGKGKEKEVFRFDVKIFQDIESEKLILEEIEKNFPDDGWISEEKGNKESKSGYIWIVDPLDGTFNYLREIPHFAISIACKGEKDAFGIVYDVMKKEKFWAKKGEGAFLNGEKIKVSKTEKMEDAVGIFGLMKGEEEIKEGIEILKKFTPKIKKLRIFGSAALDLCYVACGRVDFFIEFNLKVWDTEGGRIILEEAGGNYVERLLKGKKISIATNDILKVEV